MSEFKRLTERDVFENTDIIGVDSEDLQLNLKFAEFNLVTNALNRLSEYEDTGLSPADLAELVKAKREGRLIILPSKEEEIIRIVELALRIKLYDWQKAYILGASDYVMPGRVSGKTTAHMIKLCLSEGESIDLTTEDKVGEYADMLPNSTYVNWFKHELWNIYEALQRVGGLKLRKICFIRPKKMNY